MKLHVAPMVPRFPLISDQIFPLISDSIRLKGLELRRVKNGKICHGVSLGLLRGEKEGPCQAAQPLSLKGEIACVCPTIASLFVEGWWYYVPGWFLATRRCSRHLILQSLVLPRARPGEEKSRWLQFSMSHANGSDVNVTVTLAFWKRIQWVSYSHGSPLLFLFFLCIYLS